MHASMLLNKKLSYRRETARRAMPVEILSVAPQLYEKMHFKGCMTLKATQGHRNCRHSIVHISFPISGINREFEFYDFFYFQNLTIFFG